MQYGVIQLIHSPFGWAAELLLLVGLFSLYTRVYWFLRNHPRLGESTPGLALHTTVVVLAVVVGILLLPSMPFVLLIPLFRDVLPPLVAIVYAGVAILGLMEVVRRITWAYGKLHEK